MRHLTLGLAAVLALMATAASAHPKLLSAAPAPGGVVTGSPHDVHMRFSEGVYPRLSGVAITNRAGGVVKTGNATVNSKDNKQLVVPIMVKLAPGPYMVAWHAVSTDTHHVQGRFGFTVK